jgi:hypothetical protein
MELRECDFSFVCANQWFELRATDDPNLRHCDGCQKDVHRIWTTSQLEEAKEFGRCVAWSRNAKEPVLMLGGIEPITFDLSDLEDLPDAAPEPDDEPQTPG